MEDPNRRTLGVHCHNGSCHCDWRLALHGCEETTALRYITIMCIVITALATALGIPLALYRLAVKGHKLWRPKTSAHGYLRPSPIDCLLVSFIIYNIGRLSNYAILLMDLFPDNSLARIGSFDTPWPVAIGGITLYLIGIAQTLSESHDISGWLPSPIVVDVIGTIAYLIPFIVCLPLAYIGAGLTQTDLYTGELIVRLAHGVWFLGCFLTGSGVFYAANRLVHILRKRHEKSRRSPEYASIQAGIVKIQRISACLVICLAIYGIFSLMYATIRDQLMSSTAAIVIVAVPYLLLAPFTNLAFEILVIYSIYKSNDTAALKPKTSEYLSTQTASSTRPDQGFASTMEHITTVFFDDSRDEAILSTIEDVDPFDQQSRQERGGPSSDSCQRKKTSSEHPIPALAVKWK